MNNDKEVLRDSACNDSNNMVLNVMMLTAHRLLEAWDALAEVAEPHARLKNQKLEVNLSSSNSSNTPFCLMIPKPFVKVMQYLRSEKERGFGQRPISPKWVVYTIDMKLTHFGKVEGKVPWICGFFDLHQLGQSS